MYISQQSCKVNVHLSWKILDNITSKTVVLTWRDSTCLDVPMQNPSFRPRKKSARQRQRDTLRRQQYQQRLSGINPSSKRQMDNSQQACDPHPNVKDEGNTSDYSSTCKQATSCLQEMCPSDGSIKASLESAGDTSTSGDSETDNNQGDKFTVENVEGRKGVSPMPTTSENSRIVTRSTVTRSLSRTNEPVDSPSLCHYPQEFKFRPGTRRKELTKSSIVYAEESSGKLVLNFCNKCRHDWRDLFVNLKEICGLTLSNKLLDSFSWTCASCHQRSATTESRSILRLLKSWI